MYVFFVIFPVVHGGYGEWGDYSPCTKICNGGVKTRKRECNKPKPQHGGNDCSKLGLDTEQVSCNTQPCPGKSIQCFDFSD